MITLEQFEEIQKEKVDNPLELTHEIMDSFPFEKIITEFEEILWILRDKHPETPKSNVMYYGDTDLVVEQDGYFNEMPYELNVQLNDDFVKVPIKYEHHLRKVVDLFQQSQS